MTRPLTTIVIVGGGVIGLSTAYHLAQKRVGKVILVEKDKLGQGASGRAGGIITGLLWTETGVAVRKVALDLYEQLSAELADDGYRFQNVGCLNFFDHQSWPERETLLKLYDDQQVAYEILDPAEMMHRWPSLVVNERLIGLYDPRGGYSEPHDYVRALARRCRDLGVDIRQGTAVTGLRHAGGRVSGVMTADGVIAADAVVSTVHVWTLQVLKTLGRRLPIKSYVHQRYVTHSLPSPLKIPAINANPFGGYVRPAAGQRILAGGETPDRPQFEVPSPMFQMDELRAPESLPGQLRTALSSLLPALAGTTWESVHVGLLSFSVDGEPIVGQLPDLTHFFVGCAFHSGGFAYNPAAGLLLAELVADGQTTINIDAFSPTRFRAANTDAYLARDLAQKDAVQRRH
ncbi:MAG: FAD-binding oxidoreductase [Ardenticatenaceae bacterium]|nr:FAD-binding oxidoreductase [Ardenticatenaceae bacterium]